jgi:hypothetical protein
MPRRPIAPRTAARLMALAMLALAAICVVLAIAWTREHETAACWQAVAQYRLEPEGACP